ncbi:Homeobox domain-containing protein [Caenorhabditis elegans]|uniref:Homeobox domain-containing protein n=1 Tax=Caenorhabditis elegans TaxID=6239 RepID=O16747_CAEEL|nr:Homeobox domain-containing protein [Caenorhabditis elegans]CCD71252.2 Homeobox domain-containing protein [Caenorhabditis elegans]|eukprot:NP_001309506.1 C. Elegans Homeobox [Caenorhabditis elegans]
MSDPLEVDSNTTQNVSAARDGSVLEVQFSTKYNIIDVGVTSDFPQTAEQEARQEEARALARLMFRPATEVGESDRAVNIVRAMDEKELRQDAATLKKQKTRQYMREYYLRHRGPPGQRNSRWPQEVNDLLAEEYKKNKTPISMDFDRLSIETGKTQRQIKQWFWRHKAKQSTTNYQQRVTAEPYAVRKSEELEKPDELEEIKDPREPEKPKPERLMGPEPSKDMIKLEEPVLFSELERNKELEKPGELEDQNEEVNGPEKPVELEEAEILEKPNEPMESETLERHQQLEKNEEPREYEEDKKLKEPGEHEETEKLEKPNKLENSKKFMELETQDDNEKFEETKEIKTPMEPVKLEETEKLEKPSELKEFNELAQLNELKVLSQPKRSEKPEKPNEYERSKNLDDGSIKLEEHEDLEEDKELKEFVNPGKFNRPSELELEKLGKPEEPKVDLEENEEQLELEEPKKK